MTASIRRTSSLALVAAFGLACVWGTSDAHAATATVGLGTAASYAITAGTTITNTGPSTVRGNLGLSPGSAVTGFPPGLVSNGVIHAADTNALAAKAAVVTAFNDAAGRSTTGLIPANLAGRTLTAGVYTGGALALSGTLTLDAKGDPNAVFIFQAASTLTINTSSRVSLVNGAGWCNVFWKVGSSATIGTSSVFVGTVLALTSISAKTNASIEGRLLARNGAVTLDSNTFTLPTCRTTSATTTTAAGGAGGATTTTTSGAGGATTTIVGGPTTSPITTGPVPTIPRTGTSSTVTLSAGILVALMGAGVLMAVRRTPRQSTGR
jgi:LPXTG-motif cell wall-anchored protein